ncbi:AP-2 complex subunit alpha-2 [Glycine soja]
MQPIGNTGERFCSLCLKDSGVLYEDPYIQIGVEAEWRAHHGHLVLFLGNKNTSPLISVQSLVLPPAHLKMELSLVPETIPPRSQVQCPLKIINLHPSRDVAVLDFSYKFDNNMVNAKLHLLAVLNKFLEPIPVSAEEFSPQWKITFLTTFKASRSGMYLLQVRGVRPLPLLELANLFNSYHLTSCPGLDPNPNNLVASITFHSESTSAMLCLTTELRMTVASGYAYTYARTSNDTQQASTLEALTDAGAMLAALI